MITTLLGPPGTGKTKSLIDKVEFALQRGIKPDRIGYFAFTNRASMEAKVRAMERFKFKPHELPFFRTLHSLAFQQLGLTKSRVFSKQAMGEFSRWLGLELSTRSMDWEEGMMNMSGTEDDRILFYIGYAQTRMMEMLDALERLPWECDKQSVIRVWQGMHTFKRARSLVDFSDMLRIFATSGPFPELDYIIIDEAQDLSSLQWFVVDKLIAYNDKATVWIAGDDDQAIYEWAGADVDRFIKQAEQSSVVLSQSYRVPEVIQNQALKVLGELAYRVQKLWQPATHKGKLKFIQQPDDVPIEERRNVLHMARNFYLLKPVMRWLEEEQLDWGYLHMKNAPYLLSTIHGAKGAQADTVILDITMTKQCWDQIDEDHEIRVWYTAITRAKYNLYMIEPYSRYNAEGLLC